MLAKQIVADRKGEAARGKPDGEAARRIAPKRAVSAQNLGGPSGPTKA